MKETMKSLLLTSSISVLLLGSLLSLGCSDDNNGDLAIGDDGTAPGDLPPGSTDPAAVPPTPICADMGVAYVGLGGKKLVAGRIQVVAGGNRDRIKPFGVLASEFNRVAATTPTLLATNAATFGAAPARWYQEPQVSAVSLYTSYRVAFEVRPRAKHCSTVCRPSRATLSTPESPVGRETAFPRRLRGSRRSRREGRRRSPQLNDRDPERRNRS